MDRAERDLLRISSRLSLIKMEIVTRRQCQCCSPHSLSGRDANVQSTICPGLVQKKGPDLQSPLLVAMTWTHQVNPHTELLPHDGTHDTQLCPLAPSSASVFQRESPLERPFTDPRGQVHSWQQLMRTLFPEGPLSQGSWVPHSTGAGKGKVSRSNFQGQPYLAAEDTRLSKDWPSPRWTSLSNDDEEIVEQLRADSLGQGSKLQDWNRHNW